MTEVPAAEAGIPGAVARRLTGLGGWRRHLAAGTFGALATLALPPAYFLPVLLLAFPALFWLASGAETKRAAFFVGWSFGFGHFLVGLYWVSFALLTDTARYLWLLPFAASGLPALLAIFPGLATLAFHLLHPFLRSRATVQQAIAFALLWTAAEWLRGHVLTGFPWALIGYSWVGVPSVLQTAAVVGIYGLSLLTVLAATLPVVLADPGSRSLRARMTAVAGLGLFALLAVAGAVRLAGADGAMVPGVVLRLVQPAIPQTAKWEPASREANFQRHIALSTVPADPPPTVVIWPETAAPFFLEQDVDHRRRIAAATPPGGITITGAPRMTTAADGTRRYWNSLIAIDPGGEVVATFDKFHLVPFGEYMPLRGWLPVEAVAAGSVDFSAGSGPRTLLLPGLPPVSPLICYEVIFPGAVTDPSVRPGWLVNLTNDAWYGQTAGPHQHFAIAQVRAVEEGVPLVRVANTGISGVVDPHGRIVARLGLGTRGFVDSPLPVALPRPTPYAVYGDLVFGLLLMSLGLGLTRRRRRPV